jgi:hypothetical protein
MTPNFLLAKNWREDVPKNRQAGKLRSLVLTGEDFAGEVIVAGQGLSSSRGDHEEHARIEHIGNAVLDRDVPGGSRPPGPLHRQVTGPWLCAPPSTRNVPAQGSGVR